MCLMLFLHGYLDKEVYMEQPQGFMDPAKRDYAFKLNSSIYGLEQAPQAWFNHLRNYLES